MATSVNTSQVWLTAQSPRFVTPTLDINISGDVSGTVNGVPVATLTNQASEGYSLQQRLEVSGSSVLKGVIVPTDSGALKTGTITWNPTTGALTGGTGVAMTEWGLVGANTGVTTFSLEATTGNATFGGALNAATGTFAGSLSAATGTFAGSLSAATGTFAGSLSAATGTFSGDLSAAGGTFNGTVTVLANIDGTPTSGVKNANITLSAAGVLSGAGGGSITSLDYGNVSGSKPPANATANFFTTSASDPTGGADGDAHWNSTSSTMWFKTGGVWRVGGTVNAGQMTVGTLAVARLAASSITVDKLNVTTLSSIAANLGTVTAGSITSSSSIDISGTAKFNGNDGSYFAAVIANSSGGSLNGIVGLSSSPGAGVKGSCTVSSGVGVLAQNLYGGIGLMVQGTMTMNDSTLVSNLNADMVDGYHASALAKLSGGNSFTGNQFVSSGNFDVAGWVQCDNFRIDQTPGTGTATATFDSANKPGSNTTNTWATISFNGITYDWPVWPRA